MKKKNGLKVVHIVVVILVLAFGCNKFLLKKKKNRTKYTKIEVLKETRAQELLDSFVFCSGDFSSRICDYLSSRYSIDLKVNEGVALSGDTLIFSFRERTVLKMKNIDILMVRKIPVSILLQSLIFDEKILSIIDEESRDFNLEFYATRDRNHQEIKNVSFVKSSLSTIKAISPKKAKKIFSQVFRFNFKSKYKKEIQPLFK